MDRCPQPKESRLNLLLQGSDAPHAGGLWKFVEIRGLLEVQWPEVQCRELVETPCFADVETIRIQNELLGRKGFMLRSVSHSWNRRDRCYWASWDLDDDSE